MKDFLPWVLSAFTILIMVLAGNQNRWVWILGLVNQLVWLVWILSIHAWGLLPMNIALFVVYTRNHFKWNKLS